MRLFRKLYRKLFCRVELDYKPPMWRWVLYARFLFWKKEISHSMFSKHIAEDIEDWKNGK